MAQADIGTKEWSGFMGFVPGQVGSVSLRRQARGALAGLAAGGLVVFRSGSLIGRLDPNS
jgi:Na+/proline symporter